MNLEDKAVEILQEHATLAGQRGNWERHWQQIAERVIPVYTNTFNSLSGQRPNGEINNQEVFDSTASIALGRFSSILDSLLTPRNAMWQKLTTLDPSLKKNRDAKLWYEEATRILFKFRYAPMANFASQNQQVYTSLGAFGTGCMFTDELDGAPGMRYKAVHLGEILFRENHQGLVDAAFRYFGLTARQAYQKWGEKLPDNIKNAMKTSPDMFFYFCHAVKPRRDYDPKRLGPEGMPYESCYVSVEGKKLLSEGGYNTMPYAISRYKQDAGELYARSPAMEVLPAIKTANEQKKTILKQGHRAVDPIILGADDGVLDTFSLRPGTTVAGGVNSDGRALIQTLPTGNLSVGKELLDDERKDINDAFLVNLFQILVETPTMTATEVLERTREKGFLINPTLGRVESEYLGPMTERELDILSRNKLLPEMPRALVEAQGEYNLQYESPLTRAAKAEEASGLMRSVETALNIVNVTQNQEPLDHYNWDVIIPEISNIQGVPEKWMRSMEDIAAIRQGRADANQQQMEVQAAPAAAAMMKADAMVQKAK